MYVLDASAELNVSLNRWQVRDPCEEQTDLQEMPLRQVRRGRHGLQVGSDQRRKTGQVQELLQEEGRACHAGVGSGRRSSYGRIQALRFKRSIEQEEKDQVWNYKCFKVSMPMSLIHNSRKKLT